jgi:hypothetical protein
MAQLIDKLEDRKKKKIYENFAMLPTCKFNVIQRLKQACEVVLCDRVGNHKIHVPHSNMSSFAAPSYTSYHKRLKMSTMNYLFQFWCICFQFKY